MYENDIVFYRLLGKKQNILQIPGLSVYLFPTI